MNMCFRVPAATPFTLAHTHTHTTHPARHTHPRSNLNKPAAERGDELRQRRLMPRAHHLLALARPPVVGGEVTAGRAALPHRRAATL